MLPFVGFIGGGWIGGMVFGDVGKKTGAVVFGLIGCRCVQSHEWPQC